MKTKISVIVPIYNDSMYVKGCLDALVSQTGAKLGEDYEIIVVDDGSTDKTFEIVSEFPVKIIRFPHNTGKVNVRKKGAESARFDTLLFIDARIRISEDCLKNFWEIGYTPVIAAEYLNIEKDNLDPEKRFFYLVRRAWFYPYYPFEKGKEFSYITRENFYRSPKGAGCLFIDKSLFLESLPIKFDKNTNDDTGVFKKIVFDKGINIMRSRKLKITYLHRSESAELLGWVRRRGVTFFDFYLKHNIFLNIVVMLPLFIIVLALLGLCYWPVNMFITLALLVVIYCLISCLMSERPADVFILVPRLFNYTLSFYKGILEGLFLSFKSTYLK